MYCNNPDWGNASCWFLRKGVTYLRKLGAHPCHVGPRDWARISCEYGAGIFIENFSVRFPFRLFS
jgi:hypothetical protein